MVVFEIAGHRHLVSSLFCSSDGIISCRISIYSRTSGSLFKHENAGILNGEQEKESISCVRVG